ncbi:glycosyltransferase [Paenibacillus sp. YK5]
MAVNNKWNTGARALVLSGDLGDGHRQAARALAEACSAGTVPWVEAETVDFLRQIHPNLHPFVRYGFLKGVEKAPGVYGYLYKKTRASQSLSLPFRCFLGMGLQRLAALVNEKQPDVIICTFPLAAAAVSLLKSRTGLRTPLVTVITDHTDHSLWLNPHTDLYLVGSESVSAALRQRGIPATSLCVTGIPVRSCFSEASESDREALKRRLGLNPELPLVMVMGGGCGLLSEETRALIRSSVLRRHVQLTLICGSNDAARFRLEKELDKNPTPNIRITGFVDNIHEWMAAADLLVTKPGGLTTSEAATAGLPMLLYKPIPGQEEDNASVLEKAGIAVIASKERKLRDQLLELVENRAALSAMRAKARQFRSNRPAEQAWDAIMKLQPADQLNREARQTLAVREAQAGT